MFCFFFFFFSSLYLTLLLAVTKSKKEKAHELSGLARSLFKISRTTFVMDRALLHNSYFNTATTTTKSPQLNRPTRYTMHISHTA
uniref:Putative secreted protein ovary overexpressed n=1 Tax=Rhipicephalus microplus TaxID=6941 RepID=A0A6M2DAN3_RHIMP